MIPPGRGQFGPQAHGCRIYKGITKHCHKQNKRALGLMVSERKILLCSTYFSIWELMTPGCSNFDPQGHDWQDLCRVPLNLATY